MQHLHQTRNFHSLSAVLYSLEIAGSDILPQHLMHAYSSDQIRLGSSVGPSLVWMRPFRELIRSTKTRDERYNLILHFVSEIMQRRGAIPGPLSLPSARHEPEQEAIPGPSRVTHAQTFCDNSELHSHSCAGTHTQASRMAPVGVSHPERASSKGAKSTPVHIFPSPVSPPRPSLSLPREARPTLHNVTSEPSLRGPFPHSGEGLSERASPTNAKSIPIYLFPSPTSPPRPSLGLQHEERPALYNVNSIPSQGRLFQDPGEVLTEPGPAQNTNSIPIIHLFPSPPISSRPSLSPPRESRPALHNVTSLPSLRGPLEDTGERFAIQGESTLTSLDKKVVSASRFSFDSDVRDGRQKSDVQRIFRRPSRLWRKVQEKLQRVKL